DAINYFDEIFTSVQASENTENSITLPGLELEVSTDRDSCDFYTIKGSDLGGRSIEYIPLFSPDVIKRSILSYSLGWDMPFRVNYFLFLTSPEVAYVSVGQNPVFSKLPDHLTKEEVDSSVDFKNQNYYKVKFFSQQDSFEYHSSLNKIKNGQVKALYYKDGNLKFYSSDKGSMELEGESYYVDDTTLIAAIYSDSLGDYECNMKKAVRRLNKFAEILKMRSESIRRADRLPLCTVDYYNRAESLLSQLQELTDEDTISKEKLAGIASVRDQLNSLNQEINKKSCPTIY
ncbi:MAG: hypothetical protein NDI94_03100, partial [Candidatus Woesearchaeota archaeon]|nr:hypothetical protein [Candidatus Woesearchaeota archaeon]